jgi:UPF0755 protein
MKKIFAGFGVLIIIAILIVLGAFIWWKENTKPVSTNTAVSDFVVTKGTNAEKVGQQLYDKGFIKNPFAFKLYVQLFDKTQKVQAGQFKLSPSYNLAQIVDALSKGPVELWVTIPEGLRREEVVEKVITSLELKDAKADTFRSDFLAQTKSLEGQLFPDTYLFGREVTPTQVIKVLTNNFDKKYADVEKEKTVNLTRNEIITLASIIQREAITPDDMRGVASTFINRRNIGMNLGSDVTVEYALGYDKTEKTWWKKDLNSDDLAISSPYNTRKYNGLPPAPICNPGLVALKAASNPPQTEYLYFLSDKDGALHFGKTLAEHNKNIATYMNK